MPSPFPGMNPWIEQEGLWLDFHTKFLTAINERLVGQVRPKYTGSLAEQHIYVHKVTESRRVQETPTCRLLRTGQATAARRWPTLTRQRKSN